MAAAMAALAIGIATASALGPPVLWVMDYRTSATMENQFLGSDAAGLLVLAPLALAVSVLAATGRRIAAPLSAGIGVYALYAHSQNVIGQEYLRLPGNRPFLLPDRHLEVPEAEPRAVRAGRWPGMPCRLP